MGQSVLARAAKDDYNRWLLKDQATSVDTTIE